AHEPLGPNGSGVIAQVTGILINTGGVVRSASTQLAFVCSGLYEHAQDGGTIPTASWDATSTCLISGLTTTDPAGAGQAFGNLRYDCAGMTGNHDMAASGLSIAGNFQVLNTGTGILRMLQTPVTVSGNCTISDDFRIGSATARTLNVLGNFSLTAGTLDMSDGSGIGTMNITGNFSVTGGTLTESGTTSGEIVFNRAGV